MKRLHNILFVIVCVLHVYKFKKKENKQSISQRDFLNYYKRICDVPYY